MAFPWRVCSILEIHERAARLKDRALNICFSQLWAGGASYVRTFATWDNLLDLHPFRRASDGRFDLDLENEDWDKSVKRYLRLLRHAEIPKNPGAQAIDEEPSIEWSDTEGKPVLDGTPIVPRLEAMCSLFDNCSLSNRFNCNIWGNNKQGFSDFYLTSDKFMKYAFRWIERNLDLFGPKRSLFEMLNEGKIPYWQDATAAAAWVNEMLAPLWKLIASKNGDRPISFSGNEPRVDGYSGATDGTTSRIIGNLRDVQHIPGRKIVVNIHGIGSPANWDRVRPFLSGDVLYCLGDDGVDTNWWNSVPKDRRGSCETATFRRCCWDRKGRLETLQYAKESIPNQLIGVDWLPREISMQHKNPAKILKGLSCDIYKPAYGILTA